MESAKVLRWSYNAPMRQMSTRVTQSIEKEQMEARMDDAAADEEEEVEAGKEEEEEEGKVDGEAEAEVGLSK